MKNQKPSEQIIDICDKISSFFLKKNNNDYELTGNFISKLRVENIQFLNDGKLEIELGRPGLLIGRKGSTIQELEKALGLCISLKESEWNWNDYLIPTDYSNYFGTNNCPSELDLLLAKDALEEAYLEDLEIDQY